MNDKNLAPLDLFQLLDRVYPIGSVYSNKLDSRNPNLILGFGVWVAQTGFLVGLAPTGTFNVLAATGGAETVTLSIGQIPSHRHCNRTTPAGFINTSGGALGSFVTGYSIYSGTPDVDFNVLAGGGGSHPNLPPYTVTAIWVRTA